MVRGSKDGLRSSAAARCSSNKVAGGAGTELSPAAGRSRRATPTRRARARASSAPRAPGAREARTPALSWAVRARGTGGAFPLAFLEERITNLRRAWLTIFPRGTEAARTRTGSAVLARGTVGATTRAGQSYSVRASVRAVLARVTGLARSLGIKSGLGRTGGACASQKCNKSNWARETGRQFRSRRPICQCDPSQCDLSQCASGRGYCVRASRGVHMTCTYSRCCRGWRAESRLSLKAKASWASL